MNSRTATYAQPAPASARRGGRGKVFVPLAGAVALAVLLGVAAFVIFNRDRGCAGDELALRVTVSPDIQPALVKIADGFNKAGHGDRRPVRRVDGDQGRPPPAWRTALAGEARPRDGSVDPRLQPRGRPVARRRGRRRVPSSPDPSARPPLADRPGGLRFGGAEPEEEPRHGRAGPA